mgnify:CR=1 FL=1
MKKFSSALLIFFVIISVIAYAGNTGNLRGKVTGPDGNPLKNAKVTLIEMGQDTGTDDVGAYFFAGIPIGFYTVRVEMTGYKTIERENIIISSDVTVTEDFKMEKGKVEGGVIKVVSTKKQIVRTEGGTSHEITVDELEDAPVPDFFRMVQTLPGVVGEGGQLHIRGGRDDEVNYMVDGMTIKDPVTGTFGGNINQNSIKEITVKTGGWTAEYGGALSGIINVVTKEGERYFQGSLDYYTSKLVLKDWDQGDSDLDWQLGGPIPIFKQNKAGFPLLTFYTSGSQSVSDLKWQSDPLYNDAAQYYETDWPWQCFTETATKITLRLSPQMKLKVGFQYAYADINFLSTPSYATSDDAHQPTQHQMNNQINLEWNHAITQKLFYQVFLYRFQNWLRLDVGGKDWTEYNWSYDPDDRDYPNWQERTSTQYTVKIDVVNQVDLIHQIKTGLSYNYYDLESALHWLPADEGHYTDIYHRALDEQAFYVLDNMDWDQDLVMNVGLRYDRRQYAKSQFSPRMFVSFAINDRTKFRFNYGIFYQPPATMYVLEQKQASVNDQQNNQYLDAENATQFEYGIEYLISDDLKLDIAVYYKNTSDLIKYVAANSRIAGNERLMPMNVDHSYSQGMEVQFTKQFSNNYYWRLSYTLSDAKGTSSDPFISIGILPPREYPLDWDITHNVILQWNYSNESLGFSMLAYWHSGLPYTSVAGSKKGLTNDARYPDYKKVDITIWKYLPGIKWFGLKYRLYVEIMNLFGSANIVAVWADGTARLYSTPTRAKAGIELAF